MSEEASDEYTIRLDEDEVYEYEETWPKQEKRTHYPINGPYTHGYGRTLLSFSPGNLASHPIFGDVRVFELDIFGKVNDNDDDREAWADPIRMEILRRLRHKNWNWYIGADGDYGDATRPDEVLKLEQHVKNLFSETDGVRFVETRTHPRYSGRMEYGKMVWKELPWKRTFFEIPFHLIGDAGTAIWSNAYSSDQHPIEGYQLPPGSGDVLKQWGQTPLDEKLFRKVVDACSVLFYTFPAEHRHFHFLTNKWTLEDMEKMLDLPSLQVMADKIKAQLGK